MRMFKLLVKILLPHYPLTLWLNFMHPQSTQCLHSTMIKASGRASCHTFVFCTKRNPGAEQTMRWINCADYSETLWWLHPYMMRHQQISLLKNVCT